MGFRQRARYKFDNVMARGVGAQVLLLALFTLLIVAITILLVLALDVVPKDESGNRYSAAMLAWKSLMHTMDPGTLAEDSGSWAYLFVFLFATIGGLFVVSALIGVLNQGFGARLAQLRRGRSVVVEKEHTIILGWGPKVFTLLHELAEANRRKRDACVVILADRDKVEMDDEIAAAMKGQRLRVITRHGSAMSTEDLELVSLHTSKAVVVLSAELDGERTQHESDTVVLRTLLAIKKVAADHPLHIVAEIFEQRTEQVARLVAGENAALLLAAPLVSRLLVQTGRQSGLSVVYTELLDFHGCEIHVTKEPKLAGRTFRAAAHELGTSTLVGVLTAAGETLLPPPFDRQLAADDMIITISEGDDRIVLDGAGAVDDGMINDAPIASSRRTERTLILGASRRLPLVLRELGSYVAPGSEVIVRGEDARQLLAAVDPAMFPDMRISVDDADITDRAVLEALEITRFDHVLVLSELESRTQEMADARTTISLLHLRDIARRAGKRVPITSEILEIRSRDLVSVLEADDFIVSNSLVSLMISRLAENPHLVHVFEELFSSKGYELYVKPMTDYVTEGTTTYATVCEAAMRRNEVAVGYRLAEHARDPKAAYGVRVNPPKREKLAFGANDHLIVLAES
ncbi:MAG: potassium transporter TrkA [Kofleriaceae bacterium]